MRRLPILIASLTLILARSADAQEDRSEEAYRHYEAGQHLYDLGEFARALKEYEKAYELAPNADTLFAIAKMYELQGRLPDALEAYKRFLRESTTGKDDSLRRLATTRVRALENTPAKVVVACDLQEATAEEKKEARVIILGDDGSRQEGGCDQELALRAGRYRLRLEAKHYEPWEKSLTAVIGRPYTYVANVHRRLGRARIFADPDDALVLIDKTIRADGGGMPIDLPAGIHTLHVEAPGRVPDDRGLDVRDDQEIRINVPLRRKPRSGQIDLAVFNAFYGGFVVPASVRAMCIGCPSVGPQRDLDPGTGAALAGGGAALGAFTSFFLTDEKMTTGTAYFIMAGPLYGSVEGIGIALAANTSETNTLWWTVGGSAVGLSIAALASGPVDSTTGDSLLLHTGAAWGTVAGLMLWGSIGGNDRCTAADPTCGTSDLGKFILAGLNVGLVSGLVFSGETEYTWSHVAMINLGTAASTAIFLGLGAATEVDSGDQTRRWRFALGGMAAGFIASGLLTRNWDEPRYFRTLTLAPPLPRVDLAADGSRRYMLDLLNGTW